MGMLKRFCETMGLIALIAILFYIPTDWLQPYILPVTLVGVVAILGFAFYHSKKRGLLVIALILSMGAFALPAQAKIEDCGGTYKGGQGIVDSMQDQVTGGNIFTSDFEDENVLKCVQQNIAKLKSSICSAPKKEDSYDNEVRSNSFYVLENFSRMSAMDVSGGILGYFGDKLGFTTNDLREAQKCAKEYVDNAAKVDIIMEANCRTIGQTIQKGTDDCWPCSLAGLFIGSVQEMAGNLYPGMQKAALGLLGVMFLFWIAFRVLKLIGTMGYSDPSEFFMDLLMRFISVAIAAALLHAPIVDFYRIGISPFISMTASLAGKFSEMSMADGHNTFAEVVEKQLNIKNSTTCQACKDMNDPDFTFPQKEGSIEVLDAQSVNGLLCLTCQAYRQVLPFVSIGEAFNCYGFAHSDNIPYTPINIPDFMYLTVGALLVIAFSTLAVIIAVYILDIILRLGFVIVLTPLFITAWAFPISREYSTKAWHMLLFCLLQFIGVAVMMALFLNICLQIIPGDPTSLMYYMGKNDIQGVFNVVTGIEPLPPAASAVAGGIIIGGAIAGSGVALAAAGVMTCLLLLMLIAFVFFAVKMLTATEKVVENLSGIALGLPSITMGALLGMMKEGLQLAGVGADLGGAGAKKIGSALKNKFGKGKSGGSGGGDSGDGDSGNGVLDGTKSATLNSYTPKQAGQFVKQTVEGAGKKMTQQASQGVEKAGEAASEATEKGGKAVAKGIESGGKATAAAVDKAGSAAGEGMAKGGQATTKAGSTLMAKGTAVSATGFGAIIGIPMMIAGAAVAATGVAVTAAGHATKAASKAAAMSIKYGAKTAAKTTEASAKAAGKTVKAGSKATAKGVNAVGNTASKMGSKVAGKAAEGVVAAEEKIKDKYKKRQLAKKKYKK